MAEKDSRLKKFLIRLKVKHHKPNSHDLVCLSDSTTKSTILSRDFTSRKKCSFNKFEDVLRRNEETLGRIHNGTPQAEKPTRKKREMFFTSKRRAKLSSDQLTIPALMSSNSTHEPKQLNNSLMPKNSKGIPMLSNFSELFNMKRIKVEEKRQPRVALRSSLNTRFDDLIPPKIPCKNPHKALDYAREVLEECKTIKTNPNKFISKESDSSARPNILDFTKKIKILRRKKCLEGALSVSKHRFKLMNKKASENESKPEFSLPNL
ncbi:unnamed protein product [Moneuplotes crassus]|uniref:Uncharacterized protein n=1 Tax=Euplotes crassus TaxID=5936 RepID=A0AAD1YBQ2_EUPCR|nr:unnamed protein product [Moneuplotes crassus]